MHYQIVIIGGGPAGSSCAIALARQGIKDVLLIEAGDYNKFIIGESIPPDAKSIFKKLGIYGAFTQQGHEPCYGNCSYWGDERRGYNDTILSHYGHGWHLDRARFNQFLAKQAETLGTTILRNCHLQQSTSKDTSGFELLCHSKDGPLEISADFVVDSTGSRSVFAQQQRSVKLESGSLRCLSLRFQLPEHSQASKLTHIEAVEYGWWYGARLPDNTFLLCLYTDRENIKEKNLQNIDSYLSHLHETANSGVFVEAAVKIDEKPKSFFAPSFCLDHIHGKDWLAIGDAASAYDPITSRGIFKSMTEGFLAAESIKKYFDNEIYALSEFEDMVKGNYRHYLEMHQHYYRIEQRWPESSFWVKKQN